MAPKNKINLKDRCENGELDLSMSDLQEVPVKEIATMKKATSLDLSNNRLITLGKNFITLTHIIKLDLSKNHLLELPEDFGEMKQLKHLDLYSNQITHLPLSFCDLKNLRWLDLKNNPLVPAVAKIVGPCLDAQQCQQSARATVAFMTEMRARVEEERERLRQQELRDLELQQDRERQQRKKSERKKAARAKKKEMNKKEIEREFKEEIMRATLAEEKNGTAWKSEENKKKSKLPIKKSHYCSCWKLFVITLPSAFFLLFLLSASNLLGPSADVWRGSLSDNWQQLTQSFPEPVREYSLSFSNGFYELHVATGHLIDHMSQMITEIGQSQQFIDGMETISHVFNIACNESSKIFRTFSEKVLVITDEIAKKLS